MRHLIKFTSLMIHALAIFAFNAQATQEGEDQSFEIILGAPFQDHAVLQQLIPLPIWGETIPGATVRVKFDGQTHETVAEESGKWKVILTPLKAMMLKSVNEPPEGQMLTITARVGNEVQTQIVKDVLIGEVWIGAGQSNMAGSLRTIITKKKGLNGESVLDGHHIKKHKLDYYPSDTISGAKFPAIRQLVSPLREWSVCSPETAWKFKKVCFFFARVLQKEILLPIGIISTAVGGSKIETWHNQSPYPVGKNYLGKVDPILGYGIRGLLWYQGESNEKDGRDYHPKIESLIQGWRNVWNQFDSADLHGPKQLFSTYFVQLPGIGVSPRNMPLMGDGRAEIRQACLSTLRLKNTGMAIALDLGDLKEHPPNKFDIGRRLAQLALHYDYVKKKVVPSGPIYRSHIVNGSSIVINFDHAGEGLMIAEKSAIRPPLSKPKTSLGWVSIRDEDKSWHWADARIQGSTLVVSSPTVKNPDAVRYAYTTRPTGPLLYNKAGLPASPFTTCGYDGGENMILKE